MGFGYGHLVGQGQDAAQHPTGHRSAPRQNDPAPTPAVPRLRNPVSVPLGLLVCVRGDGGHEPHLHAGPSPSTSSCCLRSYEGDRLILGAGQEPGKSPPWSPSILTTVEAGIFLSALQIRDPRLKGQSNLLEGAKSPVGTWWAGTPARSLPVPAPLHSRWRAREHD